MVDMIPVADVLGVTVKPGGAGGNGSKALCVSIAPGPGGGGGGGAPTFGAIDAEF